MPIHRIASLLLAVLLLACSACHRANEKATTDGTGRRTNPNSPREVSEKPIVVEAYLNTKTAGVQTLAMFAQEDVEPYVISIVRRPEVLEAAVETLTLSPKTEHITTDWLQSNIHVSIPDPDTTCVKLKATESSQSNAVSIVDAVCTAFLTLERDRVQGEIDRMTRAMKENIGPNPTAEQAQAQRVWRRLIASGVFEAVPTVISAAEAKNP